MTIPEGPMTSASSDPPSLSFTRVPAR